MVHIVTPGRINERRGGKSDTLGTLFPDTDEKRGTIEVTGSDVAGRPLTPRRRLTYLLLREVYVQETTTVPWH